MIGGVMRMANGGSDERMRADLLSDLVGNS
jgi:hypothetical protein